MNRNSSDTETLYISSDNIIPTITIGSPKFLDAGLMASVTTGESGASFSAGDAYGTAVTVADMGDESRRIKMTLTAGGVDTTETVLTINTGWDASTWTDGEAEMLFYDICAISDDLAPTKIEVKVDTVAVAEPGGNTCSGEVQYTSGTTNIADTTDGAVNLEFTLTHPSGQGTAADYVIAADLHSYGSTLGANGIYRMEAVETGDNTGTFEGTVTYVQMNTISGESGPADYVESEGSDIIIMLDNYMTGSSGPRVNFGDTDVLGGTNVTLGAQLDANTHSGKKIWILSNMGQQNLRF